MRKYGIAIVLLFACASISAQTPPQLVVSVDRSAIVVAAPPPFVEVSYILPDAFEQRTRAVSSANRLLALFMPLADLKGQLDEKTARYRVLQVQVMKDMEIPTYNMSVLKEMYDKMLSGLSMPRIGEDDADALFAVVNLSQLEQTAGKQRILGMADLGPGSFTLCIAISTKGRDQHGGGDVETSLTCVTYMLINKKIILLTVTAPELSAKELRNSMRLTREWLTLLRWKNAPPKTN